jgi:hypothetical protein
VRVSAGPGPGEHSPALGGGLDASGILEGPSPGVTARLQGARGVTLYSSLLREGLGGGREENTGLQQENEVAAGGGGAEEPWLLPTTPALITAWESACGSP